MPRTDDSAAFAVNWRQVLAADVLMGVASVAAGIVLLAISSVVAGAGLAAIGALYIAAVGRRWRRWRRLRSEAGL